MLATAPPLYPVTTVAAVMKSTANKNFRFRGSRYRMIKVRCQSQGGQFYVCMTWFNDGSKSYWNDVEYKRNGEFTASGGTTVS